MPNTRDDSNQLKVNEQYGMAFYSAYYEEDITFEEQKLAVNVNIKLMGTYRVFCGKDKFSLKLQKPTVREAIEKIVGFLPSESKQMVIDPELNDPRPNALILVNGKEISVLNGLETKVKEGDQIVLIPVAHGG